MSDNQNLPIKLHITSGGLEFKIAEFTLTDEQAKAMLAGKNIIIEVGGYDGENFVHATVKQEHHQ